MRAPSTITIDTNEARSLMYTSLDKGFAETHTTL